VQPTRLAPRRRIGRAGSRQLWRCQAGTRPSKRPRAKSGSAKPATRRVLVADDERSIRLLCSVNLGASGIEVIEAEDGTSALESARRERPDLILLDVMMPGLDGFAVARELAQDQATREIPVIFLTARAEPADRKLGLELGGVGYVVKPFDPVTIGDLVEEVLTRIERGEREQLRDELAAEPDLF
jgi:two-component system, OmpR family, alkaline phosphatase synthesis response regulator PhoP